MGAESQKPHHMQNTSIFCWWPSQCVTLALILRADGPIAAEFIVVVCKTHFTLCDFAKQLFKPFLTSAVGLFGHGIHFLL